MVMRGIVTSRNGVHVLTIEFEAVESPLSQDLTNQRFVIFHDPLIGWT